MLRRVGFVLLVLVLFLITVVSMHPNEYLIGWDNYSSYLGGLDSLFRTFFSTWRAYRGIGVPGDSEVVDVFRQALLLAISPVVPEPMRDQAYILLCLWLGVLALYFLAYRWWRKDFPAAIAGGAYLLNLNTLATFYFPITTYITRFASLPLLLLVFDHFIHIQKLTRSIIMGFLAAVLFSSGSFLTATVFFTTTALLGFYVLFQRAGRRGLLALGMFVALNAFWLVPFLSYSIQKSSALRLAPVFVDTNEAQFNQAPQSYSVWKQLVLYPNFFYTRVSTIDSGQSRAFHPATAHMDSLVGQIALAVFPAAALIGMGTLLWKWKLNYRFLWIPAVFVLFLLLASQEYSPFGFIPAIFNKIPYFSVVFRFSDTKFHPYMAFAGSLAVGYVMLLINRRLISNIICIILVVLPGVTIYRSYLTVDFFPNHLFVAIPDAYRKAAIVINQDPSQGKVLHVPYDPALYWRSHTWGYLGSAWYQYMINKPYLDRTFEPGSLETTDFYNELTQIILDTNQASGNGLAERGDRLLNLLSKASIRWVLFDHSVTPEIAMHNMRYWGLYNTTDTSVVIDTLVQHGKLEKVYEASPLTLYQLKKTHEPIEFATQSVSVDPGLKRVAAFNSNGQVVRQLEENNEKEVYPLYYKDVVIRPAMGGMTWQHTIQNSGSAIVSLPRGFGAVVSVRVKKDDQFVEINLNQIFGPEINNTVLQKPIQTVRIPLKDVSGISEVMTTADDYRSNWHVLDAKHYSPIRIALDGIVMPIPPLIDDTEQILGNVLITSEAPKLTALRLQKSTLLDPQKFTLTDNPNCFGDRMPGYTYEISRLQGLTLEARNGSACVVYPLKTSVYSEIRFQYSASSESDTSDKPLHGSSKPRVTDRILSLQKPHMASLCLTGSGDTCLNTHQIVTLDSEGVMVIPAEFYGEPISQLRLALVPVGLQTQKITMKSGMVYEFESVRENPIQLSYTSYQKSLSIDSNDLTIRFPSILSRGSYFFAPYDGWFVSNRPCEEKGGFRTTRVIDRGMISYLEGCYNEFSVKLPFDSRLPKLWTTSYMLFSGKQPKAILEDPFSHYSNEYLSLYQGYPNIPGMMKFQAPQQWYRPYSSISFDTKPVSSSTIITAKPELTDTREKFYTIHQDSRNEGIIGLYGQHIMEIPSAWHEMVIRFGHPEKTYEKPDTYEVTDMLPSLTKVTVKGSDENMLLVQRVGYDRQWRAFPGNIRPDRCDRLYNCYELPADQRTWYLLYTPEVLAFIGWVVTIGSVIAMTRFMTR